MGFSIHYPYDQDSIDSTTRNASSITIMYGHVMSCQTVQPWEHWQTNTHTDRTDFIPSKHSLSFSDIIYLHDCLSYWFIGFVGIRYISKICVLWLKNGKAPQKYSQYWVCLVVLAACDSNTNIFCKASKQYQYLLFMACNKFTSLLFTFAIPVEQWAE